MWGAQWELGYKCRHGGDLGLTAKAYSEKLNLRCEVYILQMQALTHRVTRRLFHSHRRY
jgi:hypothetical protein